MHFFLKLKPHAEKINGIFKLIQQLAILCGM